MNAPNEKDAKIYEGFSNPVNVSTETLACNAIIFTTTLGIVHDRKDSSILEITNGVCKVESHFDNEISPIKFSTPPKERLYSVALQIFIPFMIAGIGTIGAGLILGTAEKLQVFKDIKALFILVPAIMGLKGNLDTCLASRLSTQANLGNMDIPREFAKMVVGNIGLVQIQAIVAACIVSVFAVSVSAIISGDFDFHDAVLLASAGTLTATTSCFILDFVLIAVIFFSRKCNMNPDNIATPLAASIGDLVSLFILSFSASLLYEIHDTHYYIMFIIMGVYVLGLLPMWIWVVIKNKYTKSVLKEGWIPVISALFISGIGGLFLDSAVDNFRGFVLFQPLINGIGGNLVSIQASRISTMLHQTSILGIIPPHTKQFIAPWTAVFGKYYSSITARLLIVMSLPGQVVFLLIADAIYNSGELAVTPVFILTYLLVFLIQLTMLLYLAHLIIHTVWRLKIDPDSSSIPYLTSIGDLMGTGLLFCAFAFLKSVNRPYTPIE